MDKPFLIGEKIYLRIIEERDLNESYQQWFNDEEICQFNSHHRFPHYRQNLEEYYKNVIIDKGNLILAIIAIDGDMHIGNIALQNINYVDRSAELAIIIGDKGYWRKGAGREACDLILSHGFRSLNLHRIRCGTIEENVGMRKLAEKLGFKQEGILRDAIYKNGKYQDVINYGLLEDEYQK